jgi:hypothetical protein
VNKIALLVLVVSVAWLGACGDADPDIERIPAPGADVGVTGTDATATVIADDSSLVRNAHP